jgi:SAM-dependent methyltransferase
MRLKTLAVCHGYIVSAERRAANKPPLDPLTVSISAYDEDPAGYSKLYESVEVRPALARLAAKIPPASVVLDVGCGSGRDVAAFRALGHCAIGVDLSIGMLSCAVALRPDATFVRADACVLPVRSGSVAAVWAIASLVHLDTAGVAAALSEFARVLSPEGVLFFSVPSADETGVAESRSGKRWMRSFGTADLRRSVADAGLRIELEDVRQISPTFRAIDVEASLGP